jgi:vacuolar-type H+-ATPase subunit E/Vma4
MAQANKRAEEILEVARQNSDEGELDVDSVQINLQEDERIRLSEAMTEYNELKSSYKEEILDRIFEEALRRVKKFVDSDDYPKELRSLIIEAGITLGGGELTVEVKQDDIDLLKYGLLNESDGKIKEVTDKMTIIKSSHIPINTIGGVRVINPETKAIVDNTFEGRLRRIKEQKRSEIENMVFG